LARRLSAGFLRSIPPNRQFIAIAWLTDARVAIVHSTKRNTTQRTLNFTHKEHIMNIAKNMEAIFIVAVALVSGTGFATASAPQRLDPPAAVQLADQDDMTVVTVTAKRLTAAEKAAL
jgi:hypothetical protein